ncbi:hypothetical protein OCK02_24265 [Rhizobium sp. TRM96647]|uniref:hypothetical protein n=1 Tax=unclassified Rhizobium TaxID=2613769 RepID=UPI0021E8D738|nr:MULTISPECIES: hypothetical protein [unclassified Rhizobium]MCV3739288.1 hypothetical protein [Rhizobium sp. TRM96647]MCV3760962.1 hypothetical protein [Rhizobium sp. TRM96650]
MTSKPIAIAVIVAIIMTIAGVAAFYFVGPILDPKEISYTTGPSHISLALDEPRDPGAVAGGRSP